MGDRNFFEVEVDPDAEVVEETVTTAHYWYGSPGGLVHLDGEIEDGEDGGRRVKVGFEEAELLFADLCACLGTR